MNQPFSWKWTAISFVVFVLMETVIGAVIGQFIVGKYVSHNLQFLMQGLCNVGSYFVGGFVIGLVSPGLRIYEPAAGAFLAVAGTLILTVFSPFTFLAFSMPKMIIGGAIAFFLAMTGAKIGERLSGNKVD
jgi:hypothetical protein